MKKVGSMKRVRKGEIVRTVHEILYENPFWMSAIVQGIANYSALARKIKPILEERLGCKIKSNSIVKAIVELTKKVHLEMRKREIGPIMFSVKSGKALTVVKSANDKLLNRLLPYARVLNFDAKARELAFIHSAKVQKLVEGILSNVEKVSYRIAELTIENVERLGEDFKNHVLALLAWNGVDIKGFVESSGSLIIYVIENDAWKALKILSGITSFPLTA